MQRVILASLQRQPFLPGTHMHSVGSMVSNLPTALCCCHWGRPLLAHAGHVWCPPQVRVRAWDGAHNTQPERPTWNLKGMENNSKYRLRLRLEEEEKEEQAQAGAGAAAAEGGSGGRKQRGRLLRVVHPIVLPGTPGVDDQVGGARRHWLRYGSCSGGCVGGGHAVAPRVPGG